MGKQNKKKSKKNSKITSESSNLKHHNNSVSDKTSNRNITPSIHYLDFFIEVIPQGSNLTPQYLKQKIDLIINPDQLNEIVRSCKNRLAQFYNVNLENRPRETSNKRLLYPLMLTIPNNNLQSFSNDFHDFQRLISSFVAELNDKVRLIYPENVYIHLGSYVTSTIFNNLVLLGIHPLLILLSNAASLVSPSTIENLIADPRTNNQYPISLSLSNPVHKSIQLAHNMLFNNQKIIDNLASTNDFSKNEATRYLIESLAHAVTFSNLAMVKHIINILKEKYQGNSSTFDLVISENIGLAIIRGNFQICLEFLQPEIFSKLSATDKASITKLIILRSGSIAPLLVCYLIYNESLSYFIAIDAINMELNESEKTRIETILSMGFSASLENINELSPNRDIKRKANALRYLILRTNYQHQARTYLDNNPPSAELFIELAYISDMKLDTITIFEFLKQYCEKILLQQNLTEIIDQKMHSFIILTMFALANTDFIEDLMEKMDQNNILSAKLYYSIIYNSKHNKKDIVKFFKKYLEKIFKDLLTNNEDSLLRAHALIHTIDNLSEEEAGEIIRSNYELIKEFVQEHKEDIESINSHQSSSNNILFDQLNKIKINIRNRAKKANKKKSLENKKSLNAENDISAHEEENIGQEAVAENIADTREEINTSTHEDKNTEQNLTKEAINQAKIETSISAYQAPFYLVVRTEYYYPATKQSLLPYIPTPLIHYNFENQAKSFQICILKFEIIHAYITGKYAYTLKKTTNLLTDEITQDYINPTTGEVTPPSAASSQSTITSDQSVVKNHAQNQYQGEEISKSSNLKISKAIQPQELRLFNSNLVKAKPEFIEQQTYNESIAEIKKRTKDQYAKINYQPIEDTREDDSIEFNNSSYRPTLPLESNENINMPFYINADPIIEGKILGEGGLAF
jgi:hypothetical protein